MAPQEVGGGHPLFAVRLKLSDAQKAPAAAGHEDAGFSGFYHSPGSGISCILKDISGKHFTADAAKFRHSSGPGQQTPHLIVERLSGPAPVQGRELPAQHRGIGGLGGVLSPPGGSPRLNLCYGLRQELPAHLGQTVKEFWRCLIGSDGGGPLGDNVSGVQLWGHMHDGDASLLLSVEDGPVDRGSSPVLGQQRGVDIDAAIPRIRQNVLRQDAAIGRYNDQLRVQLPDTGQSRPVPEFDRLKDRDVF